MNPFRQAFVEPAPLETRRITALGQNLTVRELRPDQVAEFFRRQKESVAKATVYLVMQGAVDDAGNPIFAADDEAALDEAALKGNSFKRSNQLIEAINIIAEEVIELTGLKADTVEKKADSDPSPTIPTG